LDTTTENDAPLTFDFDAFDDAARACADATTRAGGEFVDHDYAGIKRQLDANLAKVYDASHPLGYGAMPGSNPTNDAEVVAGCVTRLAPEADNPIAQEADALIRLAEPSQFKADDDPSVLNWVGWLRKKAEKLKDVHGSDEIQIARALCRDATPEYPSIMTMPDKPTPENPERRWIDDRARGKSDPPRNISMATLLRGCWRVACDATKPLMGKFLGDIPKPQQEWLWPGHIPLCEVTLIYGGEGLGKGFVLSSIAAIASRGDPFPDGSRCDPCEVLWISGEDRDETVGKRLVALGAPEKGVVIEDGTKIEMPVKNGGTRGLVIKDDIHWLETAIRARPRTRLVIIEPFSAFVGKTNLNSETDVRENIIKPLGNLAESCKVAVMILSHPNKDSSKHPADRASGSRAITAGPRMIMQVGINPDDRGQRILACRKSSLGRDFNSLAYQIVEIPGEELPRFEWIGPSDLGYQDLLHYIPGSARRPRNGLKEQEAADAIREILADGPRYKTEVEAEAVKRYGIAPATLRRAADALEGKGLLKKDREDKYQAKSIWAI
jgi:hypothetical protein